MEIKLHYKDIVLDHPRYSEIRSRDDISSDVEFLGYHFKSVAIPANMACSIDFNKAEELGKNGYFYVLHRFYDYHEILNWVGDNQEENFPISISVGVKEKDYQFIDLIKSLGYRVDFITIDIAFGHSVLMKEMIEHIRKVLPYVRIIAGNVCTPLACENLAVWGADAVKVGLSMGKACTTYNTTGVGSPMFTTVLDCAKRSKVPIIADGGVRETGDYCKALVAGATMVMVGSLFVQCSDSPAETVYSGFVSLDNEGEIDKHPIGKLYYGSASATNKGENKYVEGSEGKQLPYNDDTMIEYIEKVNEGVRSCMSYHNCTKPSDLVTVQWGVHYG